MDHLTIHVDNREKTPILFPPTLKVLSPLGWPCPPGSSIPERTVPITVISERLPTADYLCSRTLATNGEVGVAIERKAALEELYDNLFKQRGLYNFNLCLQRLRSDFRCPILLVEGGLETLFTTRPSRAPIAPHLIVDALLRLCYAHGVPVALAPSGTTRRRRLLGEFLARTLYNGAVADAARLLSPDSPPPQSI